MTSLYDIDRRISDVIEQGFAADEETGEVWQGTEGLESLQMERAAKLEGVALWLKERERFAAALRAEEDALKARRMAEERRCESIRAYLAQAVQDEPKRRFETPRVRLTLRRSTSVDVQDPALVPDSCVRVEERRTVDKAAVKAALRAGRDVPGCRLVETDRLQVM